MKKSNYNFIYDLDEDFIIYNSLTGAVATISDREKECYDKMIFTDSSLLKEFSYGGFIIEDSYDELETIKMKFMLKRYSDKVLSLCIAPTLNCNFKCSYCFENNIRCSGSISENTMKSIFNFLKENLKETKELLVTWYGGEPLLEIDKVVYMTTKIMDICNENNIIYHSAMITNGYLLNKKNVEELRKCHIDYLQITLDGNQYWHDKKRTLLNGNGTYNKIIKNIKDNIEKLPRINIRINIDKENKDMFYEVANEFRSMREDINIYLAKIDNNNSTYNDDLCINNSEYLECLIKNNNYLRKSNINTLLGKSKIIYCNAQLFYSLAIDNKGYMYKCLTDVGYSNRSFGNINNISNLNAIKFSEYFELDPFNDSDCKVCKYLPLCLGGCPYYFRHRKERECTYIKNNLRKILIGN